MTAEEEQALIDHCETMIKASAFPETVFIAKIALTALNAQSDEWQQRAEAAEAKLAELAKQEPVAWQCNAHGLMQTEDKEQADRWIKKDWKVWPLFTRPTPAADLAELVPAMPSLNNGIVGYNEGWNSCRATILRNIEEMSK